MPFRGAAQIIPAMLVRMALLLAALVMAAALFPLRDGPVVPLVALGAVVYGVVLFAVGGVDRQLIARLRA